MSWSIDKLGAFISDYNRSLNFYKTVLQLPTVWESEEDGNFAFRVAHNLLILQVAPERVGTGGFTLYVTSTTLDADRERLISAGISCDPANDLGDFRLVTFEDPDRNRLALMEPQAHYLEELESYLGRPVYDQQ